jgi:hypothetical protein
MVIPFGVGLPYLQYHHNDEQVYCLIPHLAAILIPPEGTSQCVLQNITLVYLQVAGPQLNFRGKPPGNQYVVRT